MLSLVGISVMPKCIARFFSAIARLLSSEDISCVQLQLCVIFCDLLIAYLSVCKLWMHYALRIKSQRSTYSRRLLRVGLCSIAPCGTVTRCGSTFSSFHCRVTLTSLQLVSSF